MTAILTGAAIIVAASAIQAARLGISPAPLTLARGVRSQLITLSNNEDEAVRFQLKAFRWEQRRDGHMMLAPTDELIFFPQIFEVPPHGSQSVRVGAMIPAADTERTYRLLFSQLKPFREPVSEENGNAIVSLLTNLDVAIYVEPAHAAPLGKIESIALNNGTLSFAVSNRGTKHLSIRSLRVEGFGTGKQPVLTRVTNGEVVFADGVRDF